ncbi:MAG: NAD(P)-dependent oxidoreductase [Deltaproteobacteria bacterium]|nr:NAD(P)-dependent oxidoreductase [Deltaproteobacteria bacterium]MBW2086895.1 NAD(P)-dependent oxidoreductase [Deltaproteobacteria bacterium]
MKRIGFIGLGVMGKSMASNLLKAGQSVTVYDINPEAVENLVSEGAGAAESPSALAKVSDVVWTMLPDGPDVEKVCLSEDGVFAGAREGLIFIDSSTADPAVTERLGQEAAKVGVKMLDAPVGGSPFSAMKGDLVMLVGGDEAVLESCRDLLEIVGEEVIHTGPLGTGEKVKLANNLMTLIFNYMIIEGYTLAKEAGINQEDLLNLQRINVPKILDGLAMSLIRDNRTIGFATRLAHKDLRLALKLGQDLGVPLPFGALAKEMYQMALNYGHAESNSLIPVIFYEKNKEE